MIYSRFDDLRRIKAAQEKRALPLHIIAKETGLSINTIQRIRLSHTDKHVGLNTVETLCRYFAVSAISELIEYTPAK